MNKSLKTVLHIIGCVLVIALCAFGYQMDNISNEIPRNWHVPPFNPYDPDFHCQPEATKLPPLDAQADAWFREARALEDPNIFLEDRENERIMHLTRMAAERRHWKAMLNLASMYAQGLYPKRNADDAVLLVEEGMRLGVPAAYDRMGTYYANGTGVPGDSQRAYAIWQFSARIGNAHAQSYLGMKFNTGVEYGSRWSNIPVAIRMLECAFAQGEASQTLELSYLYRTERDSEGKRIGWMTPEAKRRTLRILHEGVKFGCIDCAQNLAVDFRRPIDRAWMVVPHVDQARAERYAVLDNALSFNPYRRLPNLDKILPLPPADLPPWDGTRESLLNAAMGVTFSVDVPTEVPRPPGDRHFVDPAYRLRKTAETTKALVAPFAGYWEPLVDGTGARGRSPALYEKGERFLPVYAQVRQESKLLTGVVWAYHVTVRNSEYEVDPVAVPGLTRKVPVPSKRVTCRSHDTCSLGGIWQPWVSDTHPLQSIVNQPWRQVFRLKGQPFPQPKRDWLLDLDEKDVTWHLMEQTGPGMVSKDGG